MNRKNELYQLKRLNDAIKKHRAFWSPVKKVERPYFICVCICGMEKKVNQYSILKGVSRSCGCKMLELVYVSRGFDNRSKKRSYSVWLAMKARCRRESHKDFYLYGARGIDYDSSWDSYDVFINDMGEPLKNQSLDRIDNNLGYKKENCRWASSFIQQNNKRTNVYYSVGTSRITIGELSEITGQKRDALFYRIKKLGKTAEQAVFMRNRYKNRINYNGTREDLFKEADRIEAKRRER